MSVDHGFETIAKTPGKDRGATQTEADAGGSVADSSPAVMVQ